jgi:CRP/FNR family transcriptional regulator, cyclic AMP receptor protein
VRRALYLLGILDDVDIEWMANTGLVRYIDSGAVLIEENKSIDSLYILLDGQLSVSVGNSRNSIAKLLPGEFIGEISFVSARLPSASVVAVQQSQLLDLSRDLLLAKLSADQGFAARFYRAIGAFLADRLHVTVSRFGYGSAQQDADPDEIDDALMEDISLANVRFDKLLGHLRGDYQVNVSRIALQTA